MADDRYYVAAPYYNHTVHKELVKHYEGLLVGFKCTNFLDIYDDIGSCGNVTTFQNPGELCSKCKDLFCFECFTQQYSDEEFMQDKKFFCVDCKRN